jgi:hypothetical protein
LLILPLRAACGSRTSSLRRLYLRARVGVKRAAHANTADDVAKFKQADDALAKARTWPILLEMNDEGAWSQAIWDWAADGRGSSGFGPNSTETPVGALGCAPDDGAECCPSIRFSSRSALPRAPALA